MNPLLDISTIVLLAAALLAGTALVVRRTTVHVPAARRVALMALRLLAVAGVAALLLNLGRWRERVRQSPYTWAILLDRSASMQTADAARGRARWDEGVRLAREALGRAGQPEAVRLYAFADRPARTDGDALDTLRPDGDATRIARCGRELLARESRGGRKLTGILLLSDGQELGREDGEDFALRAAACGAPLYPVALGGPVPPTDLAIHAARQRFVGFLGQTVTISATLRNERMGPVRAELALADADGRILQRRQVDTTNGQAAACCFEVRPETAGYCEYRLQTAVREGEADSANNTVGLGVFVLDDQLRILLVEGEPYWDTKFLSHLLRGQTNMSVTAVFRVTSERFFKVSDQEALTATGDDTFPATDEAMAAYDLVVLGRGSEYVIDEARARRLHRFVHGRGGCLLFARGRSYSGPESEIESLEPVAWAGPVGGTHRLRPLLAGEQAGLFGGLLPERQSDLWSRLPPLERAYRCTALKGFATVLAEGLPADGPGDPFPVLVSRRYGRGLVLLVNGDGLWKWGFFPEVRGEHELYRNLWTRLFQWAVSFAEFNPGADYAIHTERSSVRAAEPMHVRVTSRADTPVTRPVVRVYQGKRPHGSIALARDETTANNWLGVVELDTPGIYRLALEGPEGESLDAQTTVQVVPPPGEADDPSADAEYLRELAELSGGRMVLPDAVPAVVAALEQPRVVERKGDLVWDPAWDAPWFALGLLALFGAEWYLRRRQGLL
jgi:hypothetical protein